MFDSTTKLLSYVKLHSALEMMAICVYIKILPPGLPVTNNFARGLHEIGNKYELTVAGPAPSASGAEVANERFLRVREAGQGDGSDVG